MSAQKLAFDPIKTVLVITVGMLVVFFITKAEWALYVALVVGLSGVFSGYLADKINWVWMKLTWVLSLIVPNILLAVIFYLILTPIALLSRMFGGKDQLMLKNNSPTIFKVYNKKFDAASFENPW
jgi:hypothetical protein